MSTIDELRKRIGQYETSAGLLTGALVSLITAENDEEARTHAKAVLDLSENTNIALTLLREWCGDPKVLGRDNYYTFLVVPSDEAERG